jgi:hypothetical protein
MMNNRRTRRSGQAAVALCVAVAGLALLVAGLSLWRSHEARELALQAGEGDEQSQAMRAMVEQMLAAERATPGAATASDATTTQAPASAAGAVEDSVAAGMTRAEASAWIERAVREAAADLGSGGTSAGSAIEAAVGSVGSVRSVGTPESVEPVGGEASVDARGSVNEAVSGEVPDVPMGEPLRAANGQAILAQAGETRSAPLPPTPHKWDGPRAERAPGPGEVVPWDEAKDHYSRTITVEGRVVATGRGRSGEPVFLNFQRFRPNANAFHVVVFEEGYANAPTGNPETYYDGKTIRVTGEVSQYRDAPQIKVERPGMIEVVKE